MANNLSVKIGANTADLERSIDRAKKTLEQYSRAARQAKNQIESNVSVSNQQVNAYQRVVRQLEKVNSGTIDTTQQQRVLSNQVRELKIQWDALTGDQRITSFGQSVANSLRAAESELETTKQKLASVSEETKKTSETSESYSESSLNLSGVLSKLGIAIGGAEAAQKLFTAAVQSGNDTTDLYQNTLASLTGTFDQLLYSLVHFDFTAFNDGLSTTISRFYQAADAADTLWNVMASFSVVQADANEKMARAREILSDTNASQAERNKALKLYREGVDDLQAGVNAATKSTLASINATLSTGGQQVNLTMKTLGKLLEVQSTQHGENVRNMLKGDVNAARALVKAGFTVTAEEAYALQQLYSKFSDEQLQNIIKKYNQIRAMQAEVSRASRIENRLTNRATSTPRVSTPKVSTVSVPEKKTLLQIYDDRIKKQEEELAYRQKNYEEINKRVLKERELTDELKKQSELEQINWDAVKELSKSDVKPVSLIDTQQTMKSIEDLSKEVSKTLQPELNKIPETIRKANEAAQEATKKQMDGVKSLSNGISSLGQIIGGTSGEVISMMGQVMGLFPGMIDAIQKMTMAEQARAISSGTAEGAKVPFPGNIAAIAAIVSTIMSVFASIQSFADGGIFSGASRIGDYNIARVNDGEMILNGKQQANLFRILNDNNAKVANIQYMQPEVKIKGADIYLSQKNYKNITGRKL